MSRRTVRVALLLLILIAVAGAQCRRNPPSPPPVLRGKVEYFKQTQAATMTPHGAIDMDSVKETPEGVEYRTSDGHTWRVVMEPAGRGYRYRGDPEEVK